MEDREGNIGHDRHQVGQYNNECRWIGRLTTPAINCVHLNGHLQFSLVFVVWKLFRLFVVLYSRVIISIIDRHTTVVVTTYRVVWCQVVQYQRPVTHVKTWPRLVLQVTNFVHPLHDYPTCCSWCLHTIFFLCKLRFCLSLCRPLPRLTYKSRSQTKPRV